LPSFQRRFEPFIGVVAAKEVGVADKEAFAVAISVDKPSGDV